MRSVTLLCPLFPRFACSQLLLERFEFCNLKSRKRKVLLDYRRTPVRELLTTRSSEDRQQNLDENIRSGEETNSPSLKKNDMDMGWLPTFPHVFTASMANFLFGYHIGVMNGPIEAIAKELGFDGNPFLEGLVVSIFIVGAFIGCLCSSSLSEKLGYRLALQIDAIPLIIGAILSAQAHSLDEMLWGRFLVGLGIGVNTVLVPIYISEVSPTRYRGSFGSFCQIGTCLGIIASLSLALPSESDSNWWRTLLFIASGPGLLLMVGMQFAAESPRWLCKVGRFADAESVVCKLWGKTNVESSMKEILYVAGNISSPKVSWLDLLVDPHRKVAFIGGSLFILQQLSGINGVLYFSSLTFSNVGITSGSLASLYVGITNFAGALMALYLMDNQGRKKLLVGSYLGMAFSMFIIALAIVSPIEEDLSHTLSVVGSLAYIFSFAIGAGPVTGLVIPELSSAQMRSKIMGFSFSIHWIFNFLVGLFFLDLVENFGVAPVYGAFGVVSICAAIFGTYFIVETKGRSLEEIEISLASNTQSNDQ